MNSDEIIRLENIYHLAIEKTFWKSSMLSKINKLRSELSYYNPNLIPRKTPLESGQYDQEVIETLNLISFYPLGVMKSLYAYSVLSISGSFFTPIGPESNDESIVREHEVEIMGVEEFV